MSTNNKLKKINTPQLGQGYGRDIRITFGNIDDNFGVLSNRDFMKGDTGDSLISMNIPVSNIYQINGTSIVPNDNLKVTIDDQEYEVDTLFIKNGLLEAFKTLKINLLKNINNKKDDPVVNDTDPDVLFAMRNLCSDSNNYNILFNFTLPGEPGVSIDTNYIKSIIPLIYIDQRFWVDPTRSGNDVQVDLSCTITYGDKYTNNDNNVNVNKWECVQNFPSLYYRPETGNTTSSGIYWVINGQRTSIPASGPKGIDGKAGVVLIGLAGSLPSGWPTINTTERVPISHILDTNTNGGDANQRWISARDYVKDHDQIAGAPIIVLPPKLPSNPPLSNEVNPQFSYFISYLEYDENGVSVQVDYNNIMYVQMTEYLFKAVMNNRVIVQNESQPTSTTETALYLDGYTIRDDPSSSDDSKGYVIHARTTGSSPSVQNIFSIGRSNDITDDVIAEDTGSKYNFRISGDVSVQEGSSNVVSYANGAHAEGSGSQATASCAHAEGKQTIAGGEGAHAEGSGSKATASYAHAEGQGSKAYASTSHAEGHDTEVTAAAAAAHAEGSGSKATAVAAHAEGNGTEASGVSSHAEGSGSKATASYAHAEGQSTKAYVTAAHAEGQNTTASGSATHAEGSGSQATASYAHAEGKQTIAGSEGAHAEGFDTNASGTYSHAEGQSTEASGESSHAEGNSTTASGASSHAEGNSTTASGKNSHTEGNSTTAAGSCSHAEGISTMAGDKNIIKIKLNDSNDTLNYRLIDNVSVAWAYTLTGSTRPKFLTINNNSVKTATANYRHIYYNNNTNSGGLCNGWNNQTLIIENTSDNTIVGKYLIRTAFRNVINNSNAIEGNRTPSYYGYPVNEDQKNFTMFSFFSNSDYRIPSISINNPDIQNGIFELEYITFISGTSYYAIDLSTGDNLNYSELLNKLKTPNTTIYLLYDFNKSTIRGDDKAYTYFKSNDNNIIFGYAEGAHAEGVSSKAITTAAHAEGSSTTASGDSSHAEGLSSKAITTAAHAEGSSTASGSFSHSEGSSTASGSFSHSEGSSTASGSYSHAEGQSTSASGKASHAEGDNTHASGPCSHAEGYNTDAAGSGSHTEGESSQAIGPYSHAEGNGLAFGEYSHAEGHSSYFNISNGFANGMNPKEWTCAIATGRITNSSRTIAQEFYFNNSEYFRDGGITTYPSGSYVPGYRVKDTSEDDTNHQSKFIMRPERYSNSTSTPDGKIVLVIPYNVSDSYDSNADWHDFINNNIWLGQKISITYEQITYKRPEAEGSYEAGTPAYIFDAPYYKKHSLEQIKSKSRTIENAEIMGVYKYDENYIALLTDKDFRASTTRNGSMSSLDDNPLNGAYDWRDVNLCAISITSNDSGARGNWSHTEGHGCNAQGDASHAEGFYTETINEGEHACGVLNETGYMVSADNYYYVDYYVDDYTGTTDRIIFSVGSGDPVNGRRQNGLIVTQGGGVYVLVSPNTDGPRGKARYKKLNTELTRVI